MPYQIYDTTTGARLWDCFTPGFAQSKLERLTAIGWSAAIREFIPLCAWGDCGKPATWFYSEDYGYRGGLCEAHYTPELLSEMVKESEKVKKEGQG
jgi:hypothetical protein